MKKVIVFGISGFTGRAFENAIARAEHDKGYRFWGVDRDFDKAAHTGFVSYVKGDLAEKGFAKSVIGVVRPDYLLNFAGRFNASSFEEFVHSNCTQPAEILEALGAERLLSCRCLLVGSAAEYGPPHHLPLKETDALLPVSAYGLSKAFQTMLAAYYGRTSEAKIIVARTFNILGKGQSPQLSLGSFERQIDEADDNGRVYVGNIETMRDYLSIETVVKAYWELVLHGDPGEVYNVCSGKPTKIRDVLERMIRESGKAIEIVVDEGRIRRNDTPVVYGDNTKLAKLLGESFQDHSYS